MNRFYAVIVLLMGMQSGMQIISNILDPKPEKIPFAIIYFLIAARERTAYWESMANKIDLSMPESLEFFEIQLEEATVYHQGLKDGSIQREHAYSLTYAGKKVKDLKSKYETAVKLWA